MSQEIPLNGFYESTTLKNSARRCVNLIPINEPNGSLSTNMLECPSGITGPITIGGTFPSLGSGSITSQVFEYQNNFVNKDVVFCVGNNLIATDGSGISVEQIPTFRGITPDMFFCRFAASPDTLVAVGGYGITGGCGSEFDKNLTATTIDLSNIFGVTPHPIRDVAFLGGRFIYMSGEYIGSHALRCYYTDIGSATPDVTNFFQPDVGSTEFRGLHVMNGSLLLFDQNKTFLFSLTSSVNTPFQWQRNATIPVGLLSPHTKCEALGTLFFIGKRERGGYRPFAMSGGSAVEIGTAAINSAINNDVDSSTDPDCVVFNYSDKGREMIVFRTENKCFVYNAIDKRWFERENPSGEHWEFIGSALSGNQESVFIGESVDVVPSVSTTVSAGVLDSSIGTELGLSLDRYVVSAPFNANNQTIRLSEVEPIIDSVDSQSADVTMSLSTDYGATFNTERTITKTVNNARSRFMSWGAIRQAAVFKIKVASDYPVKIVKLLARMKAGTR
jgi:hypothetical protein